MHFTIIVVTYYLSSEPALFLRTPDRIHLDTYHKQNISINIGGGGYPIREKSRPYFA